MSKFIKVIKGVSSVTVVAVVNVNADVNAERIVIVNRSDGRVYHNNVITNNMLSLPVPLEHGNNDNLFVVILDHDKVYNAAIVDGVTAQLVRSTDVTLQK